MNTLYTPEERRTVLYILSEIMIADEVIHPKEQEFFDKAFKELGAQMSDLDTMEHIDDKYAKKVFEEMEPEKQEHLQKMFKDMALADHILDAREQIVLDFYAD